MDRDVVHITHYNESEPPMYTDLCRGLVYHSCSGYHNLFSIGKYNMGCNVLDTKEGFQFIGVHTEVYSSHQCTVTVTMDIDTVNLSFVYCAYFVVPATAFHNGTWHPPDVAWIDGMVASVTHHHHNDMESMAAMYMLVYPYGPVPRNPARIQPKHSTSLLTNTTLPNLHEEVGCLTARCINHCVEHPYLLEKIHESIHFIAVDDDQCGLLGWTPVMNGGADDLAHHWYSKGAWFLQVPEVGHKEIVAVITAAVKYIDTSQAGVDSLEMLVTEGILSSESADEHRMLHMSLNRLVRDSCTPIVLECVRVQGGGKLPIVYRATPDVYQIVSQNAHCYDYIPQTQNREQPGNTLLLVVLPVGNTESVPLKTQDGVRGWLLAAGSTYHRVGSDGLPMGVRFVNASYLLNPELWHSDCDGGMMAEVGRRIDIEI